MRSSDARKTDNKTGPMKENTVFENQRKCLIQYCERNDLRLHFEQTQINKKSRACSQTVLPDSSILIGQKLVENAKIQKFK